MPPDGGGRDAILDTSTKLFSQHGYKEVSIRDIAQACGMTNAALYYHFKNKEICFWPCCGATTKDAGPCVRSPATARGPKGLVAPMPITANAASFQTCA
jgi:hypothetical protein